MVHYRSIIEWAAWPIGNVGDVIWFHPIFPCNQVTWFEMNRSSDWTSRSTWLQLKCSSELKAIVGGRPNDKEAAMKATVPVNLLIKWLLFHVAFAVFFITLIGRLDDCTGFAVPHRAAPDAKELLVANVPVTCIRWINQSVIIITDVDAADAADATDAANGTRPALFRLSSITVPRHPSHQLVTN